MTNKPYRYTVAKMQFVKNVWKDTSSHRYPHPCHLSFPFFSALNKISDVSLFVSATTFKVDWCKPNMPLRDSNENHVLLKLWNMRHLHVLLYPGIVMVILWYSMITMFMVFTRYSKVFRQACFFFLEEHLSVSLIFAFLNCLSSNYSMFLFVNGEVLHCVCENVFSLSFPAL